MILHEAYKNQGPRGESLQEITDIILSLMKPYNMHHVPSPEMPELDVSNFFLAEIDEIYVGAAGYKMIESKTGKTTLLAVAPEYSGKGVGSKLQQARIERMKKLGAETVITNSDRPATIAWYKKRGYKTIGTIPKIHSFGWDGADSWTTLELKL